MRKFTESVKLAWNHKKGGDGRGGRTGLHHRCDAVVEELGDPDCPVRIRAMERVDPFVRRQILEWSPKQLCRCPQK